MTGVTVVIRAAQDTDLAAVRALLQGAGLTTAGLREQLANFQVAEDESRIVATAGLEVYGRGALLRSVAVDPAYRGRGIARKLVTRLIHQAELRGVAEVFLLTTSAAEYFRRFGFEPVPREGVSAAVQASAEFGDECCTTAQAMRMRVGASSRRSSPR